MLALLEELCVVMAGAAAICNVVVGTYLYYSVDFQDVVRRIDSALDAYGEFLPTAEAYNNSTRS